MRARRHVLFGKPEGILFMILCEDRPTSAKASVPDVRYAALSLSQAHQLVGGQRQDAEHQMPHHFGSALNHQMLATELVL